MDRIKHKHINWRQPLASVFCWFKKWETAYELNISLNILQYVNCGSLLLIFLSLLLSGILWTKFLMDQQKICQNLPTKNIIIICRPNSNTPKDAIFILISQ